ncbi:hypothetical protein IEQ34_006692 [Dendrobium chrysotoxum]|uniref:Uncharacterized protein n=1 Tax=Dendrobium chrysotoxum TaxID=161865 RepID=A0AAV7H4C5_DENCH|nr:hypothetical protein IEQ34_006692 [Dendrobium chrysotoxum]
MILHKNFHIPNDVVTTIPKRSDRAGLPPPGYLTFSKTMTVGLIALFKDRGAVLTPEHLLRMGRLTSDMQGRVTFRCKWLDMCTRFPANSWSSSYFFVRNDWGLLEKWGNMRDLPAPLHVGEKDIMRLLKVPDIEHLLYEVRYLNKYIEEEFMFKVGLSFHPRRSDARMLKPTSKVPEPPAPVPKAAFKRQVGGEDPQILLKKKKLEGAAASTSKVPPVSSPVKFRVPRDVLSNQCLSRGTELEAELTGALNEWNAEFVKLKTMFRRLAYEVEVKALEQQCLDDGFIRGFLKGVCLMQRKIEVEVEGLTPSQASDDFLRVSMATR